MLATLLLAAEEGAEPSKAPFYILAACLIAFALALGFVGTRRHETFPRSRGLATALMLVCALLVAGTIFTAIIPAWGPRHNGGRDLILPLQRSQIGNRGRDRERWWCGHRVRLADDHRQPHRQDLRGPDRGRHRPCHRPARHQGR